VGVVNARPQYVIQSPHRAIKRCGRALPSTAIPRWRVLGAIRFLVIERQFAKASACRGQNTPRQNRPICPSRSPSCPKTRLGPLWRHCEGING
jgi:hypothetical protein